MCVKCKLCGEEIESRDDLIICNTGIFRLCLYRLECYGIIL